jgi:hypothetical protein
MRQTGQTAQLVVLGFAVCPFARQGSNRRLLRFTDRVPLGVGQRAELHQPTRAFVSRAARFAAEKADRILGFPVDHELIVQTAGAEWSGRFYRRPAGASARFSHAGNLTPRLSGWKCEI